MGNEGSSDYQAEFDKNNPYQDDWTADQYRRNYNEFLKDKKREEKKEREREERERREEEYERQRQQEIDDYMEEKRREEERKKAERIDAEYQEYVNRLREEERLRKEREMERQMREIAEKPYQAPTTNYRTQAQRSQRTQTNRTVHPTHSIQRWSSIFVGENYRVCVKASLSDGREVRLTTPYMISMIESPENYKYWAENSNYNLNDQSYSFTSRAKEIDNLIKNNSIINTRGDLKSVVSRLENANDLEKFKIKERAYRVVCSFRWSSVLPGQKDCACLGVGLSDGRELILRYPHMISMVESPENFKKWVLQSNYNLDDQSYPFTQRAKEINNLMNSNGIIVTRGNLTSIVDRLEFSVDLKKYQILDKAKIIIGNFRWSSILPGQKNSIYLSVGLSDGRELILRYPHMISMVESPENFKKWALQSCFNLENQSFPFIQRAKEIQNLIDKNGVILTCGNLKSVVLSLECDDDLKKYQILEKANLVLSNLSG